MTNQEFSNGFQVLVNSYQRFRDFDSREPKDTIEFDEYEKSLYLTKAQEQLIVSLYNGKNLDRESFEQTEELRRYLSPLVKEASLSPITTSNGSILGMESTSKFFTLPDDLWFITYEKAKVSDSQCEELSALDIYPVRQDEYHKLRKNPFRGANERRALRLDLSENNVEIISKKTVSEYYVRYLRKCRPIVLEDMPEEVTIEGVSQITECELPETLHQRILELAVQMALRSKGININNENK